MALALFDLDNTLLGGDSDHLWGEYLIAIGVVDGDHHRRENDRFYREYVEGRLDIDEFLAFALAPLAAHEPEKLHEWRRTFVDTRIRPIVLAAARTLVERHREKGDTPVIVTATNRFVTEPIADLFGIPHLLATEPERRDGRYTGRATGTPTFREGKVEVLDAWLDEHGESLDGAWFYSDSRNDLPLLERVDHPVAVDPDDTLRRLARKRGWPVITLRDGAEPRPLSD